LKNIFAGNFGDKRIDKKVNALLESLTMGRHSSINYISETASERRSFYRILQNESVNESSLITPITQDCLTYCKGKNIIVLHDTCEFNLTSHSNRIRKGTGLGKTAKDDILGFLLHGSLSIDFETGMALGFSDIQLWDRSHLGDTTVAKRTYPQQPIAEKESNKWLKAVRNSETVLREAASITFVSDRESDIYNLYCCHKQENVAYVVRCHFDRKTTTGSTIKEVLAQTPEMHSYDLEIMGDVRSDIKRHIAKMSLKWATVDIAAPIGNIDKTLPKSITITVVEAKEMDNDKGVHWILLTTKSIDSIEDAMEIIQTYKYRWYIEQLHRLLKTEGFRIESSELESGYSIRKLTLICMMAALKILQMMVASISTVDQGIQLLLNEEEIECLEKINENKFSIHKTQQNTYKPKTIKWAYWVIGRLGGWKADNKQRKAGPITLQKGLIKFYEIFEGWKLHKNNT
jgi:hypothetical protein